MSILQQKTIQINDIELIRIENCQEHFELFKEIFLDPEIMKTTMAFDGKPAPNDECILRALFLERIKCNQVFDATISIIVKNNNNFLGLLMCQIEDKKIHYIKRSKYILEISNFYKQQYHGFGIAYKILKFMANNILTIDSVDKIIGKIRSDNLSSQAIALKSGFNAVTKILKKSYHIIIYEKKYGVIFNLKQSISKDYNISSYIQHHNKFLPVKSLLN